MIYIYCSHIRFFRAASPKVFARYYTADFHRSIIVTDIFFRIGPFFAQAATKGFFRLGLIRMFGDWEQV